MLPGERSVAVKSIAAPGPGADPAAASTSRVPRRTTITAACCAPSARQPRRCAAICADTARCSARSTVDRTTGSSPPAAIRSSRSAVPNASAGRIGRAVGRVAASSGIASLCPSIANARAARAAAHEPGRRSASRAGDCGTAANSAACAQLRSAAGRSKYHRAAWPIPWLLSPYGASRRYCASTACRPYRAVSATAVPASSALAHSVRGRGCCIRATCIAMVDAPERRVQAARSTATGSTPGCHQNRLSSSATVAATTRSGGRVTQYPYSTRFPLQCPAWVMKTPFRSSTIGVGDGATRCASAATCPA